jgi:hypothetical protein
MGNSFWSKFHRFLVRRADESDIIEAACKAWHDAGLSPGQHGWDKLVALGDRRIRGWRLQMRAAARSKLDKNIEI